MRLAIEGFDVYLESINANDVDAITLCGNDYEIAHNSPSVPYPYRKEDALMLVERAGEKYASEGELHMGVHLRNGEFAGMCALSNIDRANKKAEIGYWIARRHWRHGYAKQSIRTVLGFGFGRLGLNKIYAKVLAYNEKSINLLEGLGFHREGINIEDVFHMGKFMDDITFSMLKRDYGYDDAVLID